MKKIIKLFDSGNVCVCGLRGRGKDMLMSNVAIRRSRPYVSNVDYGGIRYPFKLKDFDCGNNSYKNFIDGNLNYYKYPYPDGTDVYLSDLGIYFPSQYCNELNKLYPNIPTMCAISRQVGEFNFFFNVQNLNRAWDKIREMSDIYIHCNWCKVFFGRYVFQKVTIYEKYESAVNRVPPYKKPKVSMNNDRRFQLQMMQHSYRVQHGDIKVRYLFFRNKSSYDTRIFKSMLENGVKK